MCNYPEYDDGHDGEILNDYRIEDEYKPPVFTEAEKQKMRELRILRTCAKYKCSQEDAIRFIDLREEGHGVYQASVMAGIADPNS